MKAIFVAAQEFKGYTIAIFFAILAFAFVPLALAHGQPWLGGSILTGACCLFAAFISWCDYTANGERYYKIQMARKERIVAKESNGQIIIHQIGGGDHRQILARFSPDQAEDAIEFMTELRKRQSVDPTLRREARNLVKILNKA